MKKALLVLSVATLAFGTTYAITTYEGDPVKKTEDVRGDEKKKKKKSKKECTKGKTSCCSKSAAKSCTKTKKD